MTIITAPRSTERVGHVARHRPGIVGVLARERARKHALLPPDAQELADDEVADGEGAQPAGRGEIDPDRRDHLAEVHGVAAQRVGSAGHQAARLGDDRERAPQVGEAPHRVGQADRGDDVRRQDEAFSPPAAGQEAGRDGGEGARESDEDDAEAMVRTALGQPDAVEDHQHREVGEREALLEQEEVVVRPVQRAQPAPNEQELAGEEDAEEKGRKQAAEDQVAPVGQVAVGHLRFDVGGLHFPAKGIRANLPGRL